MYILLYRGFCISFIIQAKVSFVPPINSHFNPCASIHHRYTYSPRIFSTKIYVILVHGEFVYIGNFKKCF